MPLVDLPENAELLQQGSGFAASGRSTGLIDLPANAAPVKYSWAGTDTPIPVTPEMGDTARGFHTVWPQTKAMLGGVTALAGRTIGSDSLKDYGLEVYNRNMADSAQFSKPTDDIVNAWDDFKQNHNIGTLIDTAQYWGGYGGAQALQSIGSALVGGAIGSAVGPAGSIAGAAEGAVSPAIVKGLLAKAIEKEAAQMVEAQAAKGLTLDTARQIAAKNINKEIGVNAALFAHEATQELGSIYPEAEQQAGGQLDNAGVAKVWGAGIIAATVGAAADRLGLDQVFGAHAATNGVKGFLTNTAKQVAIGMGREAGEEGVQTGLERVGANQSLTDSSAVHDYLTSMFAGAVGGAQGGVVAGGKHALFGSPDVAPQVTPEQKIGEIFNQPDVDSAIAAAHDAVNSFQSFNPVTPQAQAANLRAEQLAADETPGPESTFDPATARHWVLNTPVQQVVDGMLSTSTEQQKQVISALPEAAQNILTEKLSAALESAEPKELLAWHKAGNDAATEEITRRNATSNTTIPVEARNATDQVGQPESIQPQRSGGDQTGQGADQASGGDSLLGPAQSLAPEAIANASDEQLGALANHPDTTVKSTATAEQVARNFRNQQAAQLDQADTEIAQTGGQFSQLRNDELQTLARNTTNPQEHTAALDELAARMNSSATSPEAATIKQALKASTAEVLSPDQLPSTTESGGKVISTQEVKAAQVIAKLLGKRIVLYQAKDQSGKLITAGGFVAGDKKTVYINAHAKDSLIALTGHELAHLIEADHPDAFQAILDVAKQHFDADPEAAVKFRHYYGVALNQAEANGFAAQDQASGVDRSYDVLSDRLSSAGEIEKAWLSEAVADMVGNRFQEQAFWGDVFAEIEQKNPSSFQAIIQKLSDAIQKMLQKILATVMGRPGFTEFITDIRGVRAAIQAATVEAIQATRQTEAAAAPIDMRSQPAAEKFPYEKPAPKPAISAAEPGTQVADQGVPVDEEIRRLEAHLADAKKQKLAQEFESAKKQVAPKQPSKLQLEIDRARAPKDYVATKAAQESVRTKQPNPAMAEAFQKAQQPVSREASTTKFESRAEPATASIPDKIETNIASPIEGTYQHNRHDAIQAKVEKTAKGYRVEWSPDETQEFTGNNAAQKTLAALDRENYSRAPDIGEQLQTRIDADYAGVVNEYSKLPDSHDGQILNTDTARELSPQYRDDRTRSAEVHEAASAFIKRLYADKLAQPTPKGKLPEVWITGGGTGSGKSTGLKLLGQEAENTEIIYDTNMNKLGSSVDKIEQALQSGRDVTVVYTYRDPVDALQSGALPRAMRMGRTVPLNAHADTHIGARAVIDQLAQKYANDPRVMFRAIDNSRGRGNAAIVPLDELPTFVHNGLQERLHDTVQTEHQAGRISDAVKAGTLQGYNPLDTSRSDSGRNSAQSELASVSPRPALEKPSVGKMVSKSLFDDAQLSTERNLVVTHNLSEENLLHAARRGGMAVPSLAVTKKENPITGFGAITLVGDSSLIDPKGNRDTKVFGADVYSPRYPQIDVKLDKESLSILNKRLADYRDGREIYSGEIGSARELIDNDAFKRYSRAKGVEDWAGLKSLAEKLLRDVGATERIFKGYDNNANKRYIDHTMDNVIKILKKEIRGGENYNYGVGSIRSKYAPEFKSIEQIRKNQVRLVTEDQFTKIKEDIDNEFFAVAGELRSYHPVGDRLGFGDTLSLTMKDAATMGIPRALKENGFDDVPVEKQELIADFLNKLKNLPTAYFEAKLLRSVGLGEFKGAVVPDNINADALAELKRSGINDIKTYKKGDEVDRAAKIGEFQHLFFSPQRNYTDAQKQAANNVFGQPKTAREKFDAFRAHWQKNVIQGVFSQFEPIKELTNDGYMLARMSRGGDSTLEAMLLYGKVTVDKDGFYTTDYAKDKGFEGFAAKVLVPLGNEADRFLQWVSALRADRLKSVGLENLFSDDDIKVLKTLNQDKMDDGRSREVVYAKALADLNDFNDSVLKIAVDSGLVDESARTMFKDMPYIPFYRLADEEIAGHGLSGGLVNKSAWKRLKGGTEKLNSDLLANTLLNWSHLITASAQNRAAKATLDAAVKAGVADEIPRGTPGKGYVKYKESGVDHVFAVSDLHLMDAITSLEYAGLGAWSKPFSKMKRLLTLGVTVNPAFKIRNTIRDTITAIGLSDLSYNPAENLRKGWSATAHDSEIRAKMMAAGGVLRFGSLLDGNTSAGARAMVERLGGDMVIDSHDGLLKLWDSKIKPAFDAYQEFGDRGENVNRAALYQNLMEKGMSHGEAAFWARDLMDFSNSGKWAAVRVLTQMVPFMNARLQGLYKLGKEGFDNPARLGYVVGAVALASMGLMLAYKDDEDWKRRTVADRQNYFYFKIGDMAIRIPKPFEIGAVATITEQGLELFAADDLTGKQFLDSMQQLVSNQLSMNPIPQLVKPMLDVYANKDSFSQAPIETLAMQRLLPKDRYNDRTSELARVLGKLGLPDPLQLVGQGNYKPLSPVQIDSLTKGYFGWLGTMANVAIDYGMRGLMDRGERPSVQLKDVFLAGNFVESLPANSSRYVTLLYNQAAQIEQAYQSYHEALKRGDMQEAQDIREENPEIGKYKQVEKIKRDDGKINQQIRQIEASKSLSAQTKRTMIDRLSQQRNRMAEQFSL